MSRTAHDPFLFDSRPRRSEIVFWEEEVLAPIAPGSMSYRPAIRQRRGMITRSFIQFNTCYALVASAGDIAGVIIHPLRRGLTEVRSHAS